jgi:hypothetical protein
MGRQTGSPCRSYASSALAWDLPGRFEDRYSCGRYRSLRGYCRHSVLAGRGITIICDTGNRTESGLGRRWDRVICTWRHGVPEDQIEMVSCLQKRRTTWAASEQKGKASPPVSRLPPLPTSRLSQTPAAGSAGPGSGEGSTLKQCDCHARWCGVGKCLR